MKRFAIITGILSGLHFGVATPFSKLLLTDLNSFQLAGLLYLGVHWPWSRILSGKTAKLYCFLSSEAG
ncbi:MAG: hypothetical protein KBC43_07435 [Bacteroidales bacterium]|nr:hypothetical protein [Bacteroidales bacterium]